MPPGGTVIEIGGLGPAGPLPIDEETESKPIRGRLVAVTGASSGIGRAIAETFAEAGAIVFALGRDPERLAAVAGHRSGRILSIVGDLTDPSTMDAIVARIVGRAGSLSILVHAAGIFAGGATADLSVDDFDRQMRTNVRVPDVLTRALLPALFAGAGQVVFINSTAGLRASARNGAYAATKHALRAVADALREDVKASGVRVMSVYLGKTATPMQQAIYRDAGHTYHPDRLIQPADVAEILLSAVSLRPGVEVTEITLRQTEKQA